MIEQAYEHAEAAGIEQLCEDEAGPYQAIPQPGEDWHRDGHPTSQPHEYVRGGTAKLLTLFRPATGEVRARGVLSAPNAVLHPWLQDELQSILDQLDKTPLLVRLPLPEDHPLLLTWQHWWWSYERPKPAPALRLILSLSTISKDICRTAWCAGCSNTAFSRSTRRSPALGSTWRSQCNASLCVAPSRASIPRALEPRDRLVGTNGGRLEQAAHAFCLEWQTQAAT